MEGAETADAEAETTGSTVASAVVGGALGGIIAAAGFGVLMLALNPEFVQSSIPALYGLEPRGAAGWVLHLIHGVVFGLVFAAIVSRDGVAKYVMSESESPVLGPLGIRKRILAAGIVFGLAIWAIFPMIAMPVWLGYAGGEGLDMVPEAAVESLLGHAVFGALLGAVYAIFVNRR